MARVTFEIKDKAKDKFKKICNSSGSNMSVEIKRFIHNQIDKQDD